MAANFDDFILNEFDGATDVNGSPLEVLRYFKGDDTTATLVDSSPNATNGSLVGTPSHSQSGYVYGEANGGNAIVLNGTSQLANLGAIPNFLGNIYAKGIFISLLFKASVQGASSFQPKAFIIGLENNTPVRGIRVRNWNDNTMKVELFDNAGINARFDFNLGGAHFWDDGFWHQMTIVLTPVQGVPSKVGDCQLWIDAARLKCSAHTPVTLGAISDWSAGRLALGANSEAGAFGWWSSMGTLHFQRVVLGYGSPTERQVVDLYRQCSKTIMGIANPAVACFFDNPVNCGATNDGDVVSSIVNEGDSDFFVVSETANKRPTWSSRFGGCLDVGPGLQNTVQTNEVYALIGRTVGNTRRIVKTANTTAVCGGPASATPLFQSARWWTLYDTPGASSGTLPSGTFKQAHGNSPNYVAGSAESAHVGVYRESNSARYSAWSAGNTTARPPMSIPSFGTFAGCTGLYPNASITGNPYEHSWVQASMYVDGEMQPTNADNSNGSSSWILSGTGRFAFIFGDQGAANRFSGFYKCFIWTNRVVHPVELADFTAACKARWPAYVGDLGRERGFLIVGDSHSTSHYGVADSRCGGWQTKLGITGSTPFYNASIGGYHCQEAAGSRDMDTRINSRQWFNQFAGKDLTVIIYLGNNDWSNEANDGATLATQWSGVRTNILSNASAASVRSVKIVGVGLRPGRADAFTALLGTTSAPCDYVVLLPAFSLGADVLHPSDAGQQEIANAIMAQARGAMGSGSGISKLGRILELGKSSVWPGG